MEQDIRVTRLQHELTGLGFPDQEHALRKGIQSGKPFFDVEVTKDYKLKGKPGTDYVQYLLHIHTMKPDHYRLIIMDVTLMRSNPNRADASVSFKTVKLSFPTYKEPLPSADAAYKQVSALMDQTSQKVKILKPPKQQQPGRQIKPGARKRWWRGGKRP